MEVLSLFPPADNGRSVLKNSDFRELILSRRSALQTLDGDRGETDAGVELDQTRVGRLSRMDAMQVEAMNRESDRRRARELAALDAALERVDGGDYGDCLQCGDTINPKRLQANLTATLCIRCASRAESSR